MGCGARVLLACMSPAAVTDWLLGTVMAFGDAGTGSTLAAIMAALDGGAQVLG